MDHAKHYKGRKFKEYEPAEMMPKPKSEKKKNVFSVQGASEDIKKRKKTRQAIMNELFND